MSFDHSTLLSLKKAVVHDSCADGTASALLLKAVLPHLDIQFVQYGTDAYRNLVAEPGMIFADFAPPPNRVQEFIDAGALVLDHHKGAKAIVDAFGDNARFGDETTQPGVCGAVLVYEHVYKPLTGGDDRAKEFATLAGIADTWVRESPLWEQAMVQVNTLQFYPRAFLLELDFLRILNSDLWWQMLHVGKISYDQFQTRVARTIKGGYRFRSDKGTRVIIFEGLSKTSVAAEVLGDDVDLVVGWSIFAEENVPKVVFSTRSHTTFDCMSFCKAHGGGGHTKAAGFNQPLCSDNPIRHFIGLLAAYEARA